MKPVLNREAALDRVGGDTELLAEIARLFLDECPRLVEEIRTAVQENDARALERSAHSLKGSVANFSADQAWKAALELETVGRSRDLSAAPEAFRHLESVIAELRPELEEVAQSV